ncbi:MAG TPA: hypothetical protein VOA78_13380 [Candidatus Dormibacteraeota bacterium]|nr:hypothetical protein [Candidatus Dormibacteraeota bacterium]
MRKQHWLAITLIVAALAACASAYWWTGARQQNSSVLSFLPRDPAAVICIDVAALRKSPFLAQLAAWAPQPQKDPDYAQFVADTGFNFERDLDHLAIAYVKFWDTPQSDHWPDGAVFIGEGKFDRQKITAYALRKGTRFIVSGHEVISRPGGIDVAGTQIAFLSDRLVAMNPGATPIPTDVLAAAPKRSIGDDWRERFVRLAGSPVFAVIRHDTAAALADRAPGGFRSPQLSTLLNQLQWITVAAKPDGDQLRIIAEGESASDATTRQLADLLNGVVILAQAGLNDPKVRQQLDPAVREAYLELLKGADISKLDRGDTKAVRLVVSVTPKFLQAARTYAPLAPPPPPAQPDTRKAPAAAPRKSGT